MMHKYTTSSRISAPNLVIDHLGDDVDDGFTFPEVFPEEMGEVNKDGGSIQRRNMG
jgi:hypothetical protein